MMINIEQLEERIKNAAAKIFRKALGEIGKNQLCGFALYTDESAMSLMATINTREHLQTISENNPAYQKYYRWSPPEWKEENYSPEFFDDINSELSEYFDKRVESDTEENSDNFITEFFESCVRSLESLKKEIPGDINDNFVLVFEVSDYEDTGTAVNWIRRLNNSTEAAEFANLMKDF